MVIDLSLPLLPSPCKRNGTTHEKCIKEKIEMSMQTTRAMFIVVTRYLLHYLFIFFHNSKIIFIDLVSFMSEAAAVTQSSDPFALKILLSSFLCIS